MADLDLESKAVDNYKYKGDVLDKSEELSDSIKTVEDVNKSDLSDSEKVIKNAGMNDDILKKIGSLEETVNKFRNSLETLKSSFSEKLGIDKETVSNDLSSKDISKISPEMNEYISKQLKPIYDALDKLQESKGEGGNSLEKSPETTKTLLTKIKEMFLGSSEMSNFDRFSHCLITFMVIASLGIGIAGVVKNHNILNTRKNLDNAPSYHQGCVQYNIQTGVVRLLGFCGSTNNTQCNSLADGSWCVKDATGNIIDIRQQINSSNTCSKTCSVDNDCNVKPNSSLSNPCPPNFTISTDGTICKPPSDVVFKCNDGACSPNPVYSTNFNAIDQVNWGTSSFCYTDGYTNYPCPIIADDYCIQCTENTQYECQSYECENGNLVQASSCVCKGDNWNTQPICMTTLDVIHVLSLMNKNIDIWSPPKTPVTVYIITGLGILLLLITFIWYIKYLITHSKK